MQRFVISFYIFVTVYINYGAASDPIEPCVKDWVTKAEEECKDATLSPTGLDGTELIEFYFDYTCDMEIVRDMCKFHFNQFDGKLNVMFLVGARETIGHDGNLVCTESCAENKRYACATDGAKGNDGSGEKINNIRNMTCCSALDGLGISLPQCGEDWCNESASCISSYVDGFYDCMDSSNEYVENDILKNIVRDVEPYKKACSYPIYPIIRIKKNDDLYPFDRCTSFRLGQNFGETYCKMLAPEHVREGCKPKDPAPK